MSTATAPDPAAGARWIRRFGAAREAGDAGSTGNTRIGEDTRARLLCLPHAGGAAGFYFPLHQVLAPDVEVLAVQYPGRQDRLREPGIDDVGALADGIVAALLPLPDDRPLALFGHSMGATVGYEVARRLEHGAGVRPAALFASGRRAPSRHREEWAHLKDDAGLAEELLLLGGTDGELLADPGLLRMVLPAVRVDYRAIETYRHRPGPELGCPIVVLTGSDDPRVTLDEAADWRRHTSGEHTVDVFPGGHFYLNDALGEIGALIRARLAAAPRTAFRAGSGSR
ncbi:thioesterase II family protein [Streptomyces sp. NPDC091268]|uniref:thioesterase II family protein n=1 Tax=Streptomyces sp. NPDC091268 TaxID=3365979 RepID=UPI00382EC1C8